MTEASVTVRPKSYLHSSGGELGPCYSLLRLCTIVFTALFWILGIVALAVGISVHASSEFRQSVANHAPGATAGATLLILAGVVMILAGFIGCFGVIKESRCLLLVFFLVLFTVFILLVACGIWSDAAKPRLHAAVIGSLENKIANYYRDAYSRDSMDDLQRQLHCCGVRHGVTDYHRLTNNYRTPESCGNRLAAADGCFYKIVERMNGEVGKMAVVGVVIGIIMLIGMALTLSLCWYLHESI